MTDTRYDRAPGDISISADARRHGFAVRRRASTRLGWPSPCILTAASFWVANTSLLWAPGIPSASSCSPSRRWACIWSSSCTSPPAPDNTNNVLALAFGVLIVALVVGGSLWIMDNLNQRMMPMDEIMQMQR